MTVQICDLGCGSTCGCLIQGSNGHFLGVKGLGLRVGAQSIGSGLWGLGGFRV